MLLRKNSDDKNPSIIETNCTFISIELKIGKLGHWSIYGLSQKRSDK